MNLAFQEALKIRSTFNWFIFHDVDLLPENDYNVYECDETPRHLSPAVDELRYV
jgi:beta-1,4-galactosyltransferase 1